MVRCVHAMAAGMNLDIRVQQQNSNKGPPRVKTRGSQAGSKACKSKTVAGGGMFGRFKRPNYPIRSIRLLFPTFPTFNFLLKVEKAKQQNSVVWKIYD